MNPTIDRNQSLKKIAFLRTLRRELNFLRIMSPIHLSANGAKQTSKFYSLAGNPATLGCLESQLKQKIETKGSLSFYDWMEQCLYHPQFGYYCSGKSKVGKQGDFFTSVSVGPLFGKLLAQKIINLAEIAQTSKQSPLNILELGANSGDLAKDVLDTLANEAPELYQNCHYLISEPLEQMQAIQCETLQDHEGVVQHVALENLQSLVGYTLFLNNELIDAFPVRLLVRDGDQWLERRVVIDSDGEFCWTHMPIENDETLQFVENLGSSYPDGYLTEFRPNLEPFAQKLSSVIQEGCVLSIDYGYSHSEFYAQHRKTGTLRTYCQHEAGENPLENLGCLDITAHVDFSQWAKALQKHGFAATQFERQASYLTQLASPLFQKLETQGAAIEPSLIRQFQTLTHPSMLGNKFFVLEAHKGKNPDPAALARLELVTK